MFCCVCMQMSSVFCCVTEQINSVLSCMIEQCVLIMLHNCVCVKLTVCLCVQHPVQTLSHSTHQMSSRDLMSCALCVGTRCRGTTMACSPARVVKVRMRLHKQYGSSAVSKCSISDDKKRFRMSSCIICICVKKIKFFFKWNVIISNQR